MNLDVFHACCRWYGIVVAILCLHCFVSSLRVDHYCRKIANHVFNLEKNCLLSALHPLLWLRQWNTKETTDSCLCEWSAWAFSTTPLVAWPCSSQPSYQLFFLLQLTVVLFRCDQNCHILDRQSSLLQQYQICMDAYK